jgi:hypothetical protein
MYSVIKTTFNSGETSYNLNRVTATGSPTDLFLNSATNRISIDIKNGKSLSRVQQLIVDGDIKSCEVLQLVDDITAAKRSINQNIETDPHNIRRRRFAIN